jgi:hypothetical protein
MPAPHPEASANGADVTFDRAQRDKMRELIWRAFGEAPPDAGPPPKARQYQLLHLAPGEGTGPSTGAGVIDPKYIQSHVRSEFFGPALQCYSEAQKRLPEPKGKIVFWFTIAGDEKVGGIVESVDVLDESTLRDPEMIECMRQSFLSVTFPPPKGGGVVTVKYPIEFSPDDPDGG